MKLLFCASTKHSLLLYIIVSVIISFVLRDVFEMQLHLKVYKLLVGTSHSTCMLAFESWIYLPNYEYTYNVFLNNISDSGTFYYMPSNSKINSSQKHPSCPSGCIFDIKI